MQFNRLSEGSRRLLIVFAMFWWIGGYLAISKEVDLWASWLRDTPRMVSCADHFDQDDARRSECEFAQPGSWANNSIRVAQGRSGSFQKYYDREARPGLIALWLLGPLLMFAFALSAKWVRDGFQQSPNSST